MSQNPIPVMALDYAKPTGSLTWPNMACWSHRIGLIACAAATLFIALIDTEFGVLGGIPISAAGVTAIIGAGYAKNGWSLALGICHLGICVLFVALVNLLNWGPQTAHLPFAIMGAAYTTLATGVA